MNEQGDFLMSTMSNKELSRVLPIDGMSRWSQFKIFSPISKEKFRQLAIEGKAPAPIRMGIRCTFYSNKELHKFLQDPLNYKFNQGGNGD